MTVKQRSSRLSASFPIRRATALGAAGLALSLVAACGGSSGGGGAATSTAGAAGGSSSGSGAKGGAPVTLTLWSWTPGTQAEVDLFQAAHPNIKVNLVNAGQGTPEYTKLRTALKAGSGAPDAVQVEFQYIPTFTITKDLVDLGKYGANDLESQFPDWVWSLVKQNGGIYGIPWDTGPMGLMYRKDIFAKYGIAVPKTWDEFAAASVKLHKAAPNTYLTDLAPGQGGQLLALMAQAGARPHKVEPDGKTLDLNFNSAPAKKWADYWTKLLQTGSVATDPDFNNDWYKGLSTGRYASWFAAAWGPIFLQGTAKNTSGKWAVAELPQWNAGDHVTSNWGGSTLSVTKQSKHPAEAAELAKWLMTNPASAKKFSIDQFLFPSEKSVLTDPDYADQKVAFFGGQQVNKLYATFSDQVPKDFTWSPFQDYVYTQMNSTLGKAITAKGDLSAALDALQNTVSTYAKSQGFKVSGG
jgi:multiple sugar transport system substrate-binding protein